MKRRKTALTAVHIPTTARTGEHCPRSGLWFVATDDAGASQGTKSRYISEGSLMPSLDGSPAEWLRTAEVDS